VARRARPAPLYARLPRGPSRLCREDVARNQRARLLGAMVQAVSEQGYAATTVADVIALAGVSRRAFYEQFANKEACFLAALGAIAAGAQRRTLAGWRAGRGWADRLERATDALLEHIAAAPSAAHVLLVDSLGTTPAVHARLRALDLGLQRLLVATFALAPDGAPLPAFGPAALAGGLRHLAYTRLREGRAGELAGLAGPLLDWADCYRARAADHLATEDRPGCAGPASAGGAELGVERPAPGSARERARILRALVALGGDEGFTAVSEARLAQEAAVSVDSLRRCFASTEDCLGAALAGFAAEAVAAVEGAVAGGDSWPEAVLLGVDALVGCLRADPPLACVTLVEAPLAGPRAADLVVNATEAITRALLRGAPPGGRGGAVALPATAGALAATIATGARTGRAGRGAGVRPGARAAVSVEQLAYVVLAPRLGSAEAARAIAGARRVGSRVG
jgi:AcrR family transcriptional regulator